MLPKGDVARGEEGVLSGIPAEEVRRGGVAGMSFAAGPYFVKQEGVWAVGGTVQVVGEAAFFFARGADEGAQFGFEEDFLAVAWTKKHDERHRVFWELGDRGRAGFVGTG